MDMVFVQVIFWLSLFLLVYNYFLYPIFLSVYNKLFRNKERYRTDSNYEPRVTLVISAYNEEDVIQQKLENSLELEYPLEKLEILVISDASDDRTDEIVNEMSAKHPHIRLIRMEQRGGKTIGLNAAVHNASGEVVVFSDANAIYQTDAIRELVKYFVNDEVGYVVGKALYYEDKDNTASENESLFWKYETYLKELESKFHSVCVGDGAIYSIRKELYQDLAADDIGDFANPLIIASKSYMGIFNTDAVCYESAAGDYDKEFSRKRRIVNRSFRAFRKYIKLFSLRKHYIMIFELISHKILRWFNWLLLLLLSLSNIILFTFNNDPIQTVVFALQMAFIGLAITGFVMSKVRINPPTVVHIPHYFSMVHYAAFLGIVDDMKGKRYATWDTPRADAN